MVEFYNQVTITKEFHPMNIHDVIFLRDNPLDNHVLNFLDTLDGSTLFINSISGLRKANNKIYPATLSNLYNSEDKSNNDTLTTVSRNKEYLKQVIEEYDRDKFILKPMDGYADLEWFYWINPQRLNIILTHYLIFTLILLVK